ncbi:MAG: protein kinase [Myxococcaceae bacterium]|nr:protein kinase [Myxococcaceae bacterium]
MPEDYNSHSEHTVVFLVAPGDILDDRWLIEARIGQGAMGSVFRGKDTKLDRKVAIKILAPEHCRKPKVLARFEREAKLMSTLRHPNIIQLFGVGRRGALPYIVMQFLEGMTLGDVLKKKGGKLTPGETLAVVKQIAAGLSFIHHHGLVHRDIKPQNIIVSPGGRVTILDLGVVRDKSNPGLTKAGAMVGTPYYMSPEQIQGTDEIDKRTDVYALAAMTFELLCGRPPFLGQSNFEVLHAHRYLDVPDATELNKAVNKQVSKALANAMSKKREDRPLSATEFAADLEAFFSLQERVDPAVAFAFLDELAEEEERKLRNKPSKSTRAPTVPLMKAQSGGAPPKPNISASHKANPVSPNVTGSHKANPASPNVSASHKANPPASTPSEIPMARSQDVHLLTGSPTGPIDMARAAQVVAKKGEAANDTHAGTEMSGEYAPSPDETSAEGVSASDTNDDEGTEEKSSGYTDPGESEPDEPEDSDPGATVTESGELRVITTLKGLTTTATLFIDGRKQGSTPLSLQVPAGRHDVRVERPGYKPQTKVALVTANQVSLVRIELATVSK